MTSSRNSTQLRVTVTPVRNRKPKHTTVKTDARRAYADKLLDLLHDENIVHVESPEIFVSVLAQAAQDLYKV